MRWPAALPAFRRRVPRRSGRPVARPARRRFRSGRRPVARPARRGI